MSEESSRKIQQVVAVLWPSFLTASAATVVTFTLFDPWTLFAGTAFANLSRLAGYSIGFFCFWAVTAATSLLTCYFQRPPSSFNPPSKDGTA